MRKFRFFLTFCATSFVFGCNQLEQVGLSSDTVSIHELVPEAVKIVRESLSDKSPLVRTNAIEVVSATGRTELMPIVEKSLRDEFVPVRFAAALAVGDSRYRPAINSIKQLLHDKNENVKIAAAYALTKLSQRNYDKVFHQAVKSDDQTVRANAALVLGKLGDKKALKLLYWIIRAKDSEDMALYQAAESIAMLGDKKIYKKLWAMLISGYGDVRVMGIRAMGALKTAEAKNALVTLLDDEVPEVRLAAAAQLGLLGDKSGELEVLNILRKPDVVADKQSAERINVLAALAVENIGTPQLAKFLPEFLANESKIVRLAAAKAVFTLTQ